MSARWLTAAAFVSATFSIQGAANAAISVSQDPILYWNDVISNGPNAISGAPPVVARNAAIVDIAMFDAVDAALGSPNVPYLSGLPSLAGDTRAAAATAAHDVLLNYVFPSNGTSQNAAQRAAIESDYQASLALVPDGQAKSNGIALGQASAAQIISARINDGASSAQSTPYVVGSGLGVWQPTVPGAAPILPGFGNVKPFLLTSADQFEAAPPPAIGSLDYAAAYNLVKLVGAANSEQLGFRTHDQTQAALFWAAAGGASWVQIGVGLAANKGLSTLQNAQLFALLTSGLTDAFITVFDAKYENSFWRPVTAIHAGDIDGNPLTVGDPNWTSLLPAPNHPDYYSAHAVADGTAAAILLGLVGDQSFCATFGGIQRCFAGINAASVEGANSRIWGGIHFPFDATSGLDTGTSIGQFALNDSVFRAVPEPATWMTMVLGFALLGWTIRRRSEHRGVKEPLRQLA